MARNDSERRFYLVDPGGYMNPFRSIFRSKKRLARGQEAEVEDLPGGSTDLYHTTIPQKGYLAHVEQRIGCGGSGTVLDTYDVDLQEENIRGINGPYIRLERRIPFMLRKLFGG